MALSSTVEWDIQIGGNDANGGGYNSAAVGGTDRSQSTTVHVAIDNSTITSSITANVITLTGYTVLSTDVGNVVQMLTGTNVTAGFYQITTATPGANTWTVTGAANLPTSGTTTDATGNMGGCLLSPGKAAGAYVASNKIWLKYSATTYDVASTTANIATGRMNFNVISKGLFQGYDVTHGDYTANRPTIKATTNTMTLVTIAATGFRVANMIISAGAATGILPLLTGADSAIYRVRTVGGNTTAGISMAANSTAIECEATTCTVEGFRCAGAMLFGCVAAANTDDGFDCTAGGNMLVDCLSINNTGGGVDGFTNSGATSGMVCVNCLAYGNGQTGFGNVGIDFSASWINCLAVANGADGLGGTNAAYAIHCAAQGNTLDQFDAATVQISCVTLTGDPFTNAAGSDFSLDNTTDEGAACRGAGYPGVLPALVSTTGAANIGPVQHTAGAATTIFKSAVGRWSF